MEKRLATHTEKTGQKQSEKKVLDRKVRMGNEIIDVEMGKCTCRQLE